MREQTMAEREFIESLTEFQRERFWDRVDCSTGLDECWPWLGAKVGDGYGQFSINGHRGARAHRIAYFLSFGEIPEGLLVCHACDNRLCCNPRHFWLGTNHENLRDMVKKGRHPEQQTTHCPRRHEYTAENTYVNSRGWRVCKACRREKLRAARAKRAEQRYAA